MATLDIVWGVPSSRSLGNTGATDPDYESITFLTERGITLSLESGHSGWTPANPTLKNDGVRADSALENGSTILASAWGTVTETLSAWLVGADTDSRAAALKKLYRFAEAALDFQAGIQSQPVYFRWQAECAPAEQYALIVKIDISFTEFDLIETAENAELTIVVEREPIWRALPPMDNPKKWAFYSRNLKPTNSGAPAATEYNYTHLNLLSAFAGAASYRSLYQQNIRNYDEIGTANVNYVDIAAADIPGDAPALALVNWTQKSAISPTFNLWVARTTQPDYFPASNTNVANQRAKNTFNGGDATLSGGAVVTTKPVTGNGLLSNGSIVNRYVMQGVYAAGAVAESLCTWTRSYAQYRNKYVAFLRGYLPAGVITELKFWLQWYPGAAIGYGFERTTSVQLKQAGFGVTYLGVVDFNKSQRRQGGVDGTGVDVVSNFTLGLYTEKIAGAVATFQLWDIILMPFDEALGNVITSLTFLADATAFIDKTGYFGQDSDAGFSYQGAMLIPRELRGQAIELVPGVTNRLYMLADLSVNPSETTAHECRVDIIPRWYGVRDR